MDVEGEGLLVLITDHFMHKPSDSFSSPFKRFKPYQDHPIFASVWFIVGFSRYHPRNVHKASLYNSVNSDLEILRVFVSSNI